MGGGGGSGTVKGRGEERRGEGERERERERLREKESCCSNTDNIDTDEYFLAAASATCCQELWLA